MRSTLFRVLIRPAQLCVVSLGLAFNLACAQSPEGITTSASGAVISDLTASATRYSSFDGNVDEMDDLSDLVDTAWGNGGLGLHRGHAPIKNVLEAFLGISHREMHVLMEQGGLNLDGVCRHLGLDTGNLVESLVNSFTPYVEQGVANGVIDESEAEDWIERIRTQFQRRVYWEG